MDLTHIPLDQLKVSALNMRHARKAPDIADILPSIRARGVQQPLLVRPNGKGFEIVAGRRRFFALKTLAKEGCAIEAVPCAVMADGDDAAALEASLIENLARLDPDEMSRWETFSRLVKEGRSIADIATTFGVSEIMIRRALALGNLLPAIRRAYRGDEIDADTIRQLTLASESQQKAWLALFNDPEQRAPRGWQLKQWLWGAEISTDAALFSLKDYKGGIVSDLFGEASYFDDPEQFWVLQNAAIGARRDALQADGWPDVTVLDVGQRWFTWEHVAASKEDGGRVYVEVRETGEVAFHEGFITCKEHQRRQRNADASENGDSAASERPELTKAAENYLALHRHAAVRHALLARPDMALRLVVAHAIVGSNCWRVLPDPQPAEKEATAESLAASKAQAGFAVERSAILDLLEMPADRTSLVRPNGDDHSLVVLVARLLTLSDADVLRVLALVMAESLDNDSSVVEALGAHLTIEMAEYWEPEETFFDLLRDKAAINAMLREVGGKYTADANLSATVKVQKQIIRDYLTGEGRTCVEGWLPRYMQFPFKSYCKGRGGRLANYAKRVRGLIG